MFIGNFSSALLARPGCPVSRDPLDLDGDVLRSHSGFAYPMGDFRTVAEDTSSTVWSKGQSHYEKNNCGWVSREAAFFQFVDHETTGSYREIPLAREVLDVGGGLEQIPADAEHLPFRYGTFDTVPMRSCLDQFALHSTEESLRALVSGAGVQVNQRMLQEGYSGIVYLSATPTATPVSTASATP